MMLKFVREHKHNFIHALISSMIILLSVVMICMISRITPFGNKTFLMFDLKRQYIDYYSYLRSILSGENNVLYSFSTALGSSMLGFEMYYISSPLLLILSFFPREYLPMGVTILITIKLALAGFIMDLFLQYYTQKTGYMKILEGDSIKLIIGSVSWGLSSFLFAHSMNLMWIDVILLLPLVIWLLDRVIICKKRIPYILCISIILWLNYYITYQIFIFIAMWTFFRVFTVFSKDKLKSIGRVIVSTAIGGLIDAFVLIPTAIELFDSPKDITQLGLETTGSNLRVTDIFSKLSMFAYDDIEARFGWPQVYCSIVFTILFFIYMLHIKRNSDNKVSFLTSDDVREKIGMAVMLLIIFISFMLDGFNLFWHAGMEPSGHPYRQAFIFIFLVILCGTKALIDINEVKFKTIIVAVVLSAIVLISGLKLRYDHISKLSICATLVMLTVYATALFIIYFTAKKEALLMKNRSVIGFMLLLLTAELIANDGYTYAFQAMKCEKADEFKTTIEFTSTAVEYMKQLDKGFYRAENLNPRQQNDAMQYSFNGVTHYSSAGKTYVRYLLQRMGFNDDSLYTHYGHDNTKAADMLLGLKYIISDDTFSIHEGYELVFNGNVSLYENPYYAPIGIMTNGFNLTNISLSSKDITSNNWNLYVPELDPFSLQEDMVSRITGEDVSLFKEARISENDTSVMSDDGDYIPIKEYSVEASEDGEMYMYIYGIQGKIQALTIYVDDELLTSYGNDYCLRVLNLGYMKKGEKKIVKIDGGSKEADFGRPIFVSEDKNALYEISNKLRLNEAKVIKNSSSNLKLITGDCDGVFLAIPAEKGWRYSVDGKYVDAQCVYGALTYIPINEKANEHIIEMRFVPEGMSLGIIISIISLIAFTLICLNETNNNLCKKKEVLNEKG